MGSKRDRNKLRLEPGDIVEVTNTRGHHFPPETALYVECQWSYEDAYHMFPVDPNAGLGSQIIWTRQVKPIWTKARGYHAD